MIQLCTQTDQEVIYCVKFNVNLIGRNVFAASCGRQKITFKFQSNEQPISGSKIVIIEIFDKLVCPEELKIIHTYDDTSRYLWPANSERDQLVEASRHTRRISEDYWTIDWSFNQRSQQHIVAFAGSFGRIRVVWLRLNGSSTEFQPAKETILDTIFYGINELKFHPKFERYFLLLSASQDRSIRLWNIETQACIAVFSDHVDQVLSIDFDESGCYFVSAGMDHSLKIWNLDSEDLRAAIDNSRQQTLIVPKSTIKVRRLIHSDFVDSVVWIDKNILISKSPSQNPSKRIAMWTIGSFEDAAVLKRDRGKILKRFELHHSRIWFFKMTTDLSRRFVAVGNTSGQIYVYDIANCHSTAVVDYQRVIGEKIPFPARSCSFSRDGRILIVSYDDSFVAKMNNPFL